MVSVEPIDYYVSADRLEQASVIAPKILAINPDLTAEWLATRTPGPRDEIPHRIARLRSGGLP